MNVHLTFDVEVWCNGWGELDSSFKGSFDRYVYGSSRHGQYALPKTLEILNRNSLHGVFFVEPLFAARFGLEHLQTIVKLIRDAGQEVQLHIHPEWTDEITPAIILDNEKKRQHLTYYSVDEQTRLIAFAKDLLERAGSGPITAFRAGSFAANYDTFEALRRNAILIDSSLNRCYSVSGQGIKRAAQVDSPFVINGVSTYPVTVFRDGFGKNRPAHVAACGREEMRESIASAKAAGLTDFTIVSHNFEMLKPGGSEPSWVVVRRFERLCAYLAEHSADYPVTNYSPLNGTSAESKTTTTPAATLLSTARRHAEQLISRLV
jgi:hypothetical protein